MIDTWFYEDVVDQPVKLDFDPDLTWIKKHVVKTSFIVGLDGDNIHWVLSRGLYLGNPEDAMVGYPDISSAWEESWKHNCPACNEELFGAEERLGYCIECACDMLENLAACKVDEPEDAMFEGHPGLDNKPDPEVEKTAYWMCPCSEVNVATSDYCTNCGTPMIEGVEINVTIVEPA